VLVLVRGGGKWEKALRNTRGVGEEEHQEGTRARGGGEGAEGRTVGDRERGEEDSGSERGRRSGWKARVTRRTKVV